MKISDFSPVRKSHTGSLRPGLWEGFLETTSSYKQDILWILWSPRTAANTLYTHCDCRAEQQDC
ncbi:hypothetical protein PDJAM_G00209670 [Pangasius djambal]|uniref:Uncharacterized protein n=1 Tax=Pangasius djambal TaxID=1691987 RepID=A0ACC5YAZ4_9TELE|nr:hypothetical protein [Pangasius djambal]